MKLLFILFTTLSSFFAQAANTPVGIDPAVIRAFAQTFANSSNVSWTVEHDLFHASFEIGGRTASAFYNKHGELVIVTRYINATELPVMLQVKIQNKYSQYKITESLEASDETGTNFYVTLEDAKKKIILKSNGTSSWGQFARIKK